MSPTLIGAIVGGVALASSVGYAALQTARLDAAQEREKAKDLVIKSQADELDRTKRLQVASQTTAEELQRRLDADRQRDDEIRRTLDDAIQAARAAGAKDCPTPAGVESVLRGQLRKPADRR
jgi:gas vesicle protein